MASETSVLRNAGATSGRAVSPPARGSGRASALVGSPSSRRSRNRSRPRPRPRRPRSPRPSGRASGAGAASAGAVSSALAAAGNGRMPSAAITVCGSIISPTGIGISAVSSSATSTSAPRSAPSSAGSPSRGSRSRSPRSRPRPRRPRRPRRSRSSRPSRSRRSSAGTVGVAAAAATTVPSGTSTSSWPLSSLVTFRSPRCCASCTKRENFGWPRFFSSNDASISCITCLRRSLRMTSPLRFMRPTASVTSSQGSQRVVSSSPVFTRPASALYE